MAYHVELRRSHYRAWAFNLDEQELRRTVLEPWIRDARLTIGGREWEPRESTLRVLEGGRLAPPDLAHGQGWNHAQRSGGRDVARELLAALAEPALTMTVVAEGEAVRAAAAALLRELAAEVVDWTAVRAALLAADRRALPVHAALVVAAHDASTRWYVDAGLALGALGPRAVLVALDADADAAAQLAGMKALRLKLGSPAACDTLAQRLRDAGCSVSRLTPTPARAR